MRCVLCQKLSLSAICKPCQDQYLSITPQIRVLEDIKIYSFYPLSHVDMLIASKYHTIGSRIYKILSERAAQYFAKSWNHELSEIYSLGIDCPIAKGAYSHTAIILHSFRRLFKPIYHELRAQNPVKYAGKSLEFRKNNPRNLCYQSGQKTCVVLDDVITTGTSMLEARDAIRKGGGEFLFGIALCDARN